MSRGTKLYLSFLFVTAEDYFPMDTIELTFMSGSPLGTMRNATIVILDDIQIEGAETFMVNLVSSNSQVTLGNPSSATVVIVGDDGKCCFNIIISQLFHHGMFSSVVTQ